MRRVPDLKPYMLDLSIIIPVKKGESSWRGLLQQLNALNVSSEIILVGPEFHDHSQDHIHYLHSQKGRAGKLNEGAIKAKGKFLWFLHADSKIAANSLSTIEQQLAREPETLHFFDLSFLSDGPYLTQLNAIGANIRSRFLKMPFGDQAFFLKKSVFINLGLFDEDVPYGEDHILVWRAHQRRIRVKSCGVSVATSSRKYQSQGWLKTSLTHIYLTYKQALPELLKKLSSNRPSAIAIFVKTPGHSALKTRLAETIGKEKAEEFFKLSVKATEAVVIAAIKKSKGQINAYWAVSEPEALNHPLWNSLYTLSQESGSLGERLDHVYKTLLKQHPQVHLIGADLPHLPYETLLQAETQLLSAKDFVMGKTEDGGFYLFGGKREISHQTWTSVTYSTEKTALELEALLGVQNFTYLPVEFDVDYEEDLKKISSTTFKHKLLPAQLNVLSWIKELLS